MGLIAADMSSDYRASFVPKTITDFLKEVALVSNAGDKKMKIDDLVMRLEEEMRKIDAFKRELPLCMLLLNDAITALKDESVRYCFPAPQPVLAEFIPLKKDTEEHQAFKRNTEKDSKEKKNWMSSFQLWNDNNDSFESPRNNKTSNKIVEDHEMYDSEDRIRARKSRNEGKGFMPFKTSLAVPVSLPSRKQDNVEIAARVQSLSLRTPGMEGMKEESVVTSCSRMVPSSEKQSNSQNAGHQPPHQPNRKQRRCWSPELHRKFVGALQQLGGAQVATPKQIRELMQVDGLTNDEVKSHLQKFRLHTRRAVHDASSSANRSVGLGSLWVSQDQYSDSTTKEGSSQSGSPQGPLQLAANAHANSGNSVEVEEDDKSDGHSWKSHIQKPRKDDV